MASFDFNKLKKNRTNSFDKLSKQLEEVSSKGYSNPDENKYWKPTLDQAGNGYAVIRFLPAPEGEDVPFVRLYTHAFKGPTGQWYIENCLSTLKQDDPVNELNNKLWNSTEDDKSPERTQARVQKRKLNFISNIYIVSDPSNPENEGKVFLFKYGKKIFDKLKDAPKPEFEGETAIDPFDLWENGANFRLKIRKVDGYPNYDKSDFATPEPLFDNDDEYGEKLVNIHSLQEIVDTKNFKAYDVLKERLHRVLGLTDNTRSNANASAEMEDDDDISISKFVATAKEAQPIQQKTAKATLEVDEDEDDDMEYFKSLAKKG